jgi:RES domain-containing protein
MAGAACNRPGPAPPDRPFGEPGRRKDRRRFPGPTRARCLRVVPPPPPLGPAELVAWRLDQARYRAAWDSGEGAYRVGGRWNSKGVRAVYCSADPATAILEVAVHKGFRALDTVAHVLTAAIVTELANVYVLDPASVPNANWMRPGIPSAGQQAFGDALLARHQFVLIPSVVSSYSWNLIFSVPAAAGAYRVRMQQAFALDPRLHPPVA